MFNQTELTKAIELQKKSFILLKWLESAISQGFVSASAAHSYSSASEAAFEWISRHYSNIPPDCRPERPAREELEPFANMFSSYLLTSFDLVENPGMKRVSKCGCSCPICSYLIAAPHLRAKKLSSSDKKRARKLKLNYLRQLALECEVSFSDEQAKKLADTPELIEPAAMCAYGEQLILRFKGHVEGPAVLALWREFAWTRKGSPKKKFSLDVGAILSRETVLCAAIRGN